MIIILIGFAVSLTIEILQTVARVIIGYNTEQKIIDDLMMNTLGTIIGLIVFRFFYLTFKRIIKKRVNSRNILVDPFFNSN
ncbi:VanZ family protein [Bacillus sp. Au-Bac7]|uniref:VanZ family protein n=1 Tax=Bacillus sp. Au-Bac7 TaxID=2906458 RepID=UPI003FA3A8A1